MVYYYESDCHTVNQELLLFTTGQTLEDWLADTLGYRDGSISMNALINKFAVEGNATSNIDKTERLHDSLHYKNGSSMDVKLFLTKCQNMYNILEEEGESMEEDAKISFLLKKLNTHIYRNQLRHIHIIRKQTFKVGGSLRYGKI